MLVLNLPFKALMFLTLMRPSLVLFLRSEERFSRNAETDLVCRLLLEKKKHGHSTNQRRGGRAATPARLGPVHPRPDSLTHRGHPRHRRRRADDRLYRSR